MSKKCKKHGLTLHHRYKDASIKRGFRYRCGRCMGEAVSRRQRKVKGILVEEFGGACQSCGYNAYNGALTFHHVNPSEKELSMTMARTKALDTFRKEARKCVLVCMNCHAEIEANIRTCPERLYR